MLTQEEESSLIKLIDAQSWDTTLKRRTQHYGFRYDYTSKEAAEKVQDIPKWCHFIVARLTEQAVLCEEPDQLIINEYTPGQGIYPHVDDVKSFQDGIVSISLGSPIVMDFVNNRNSSIKKELLLTKRSALCLHRDARYQWRHGITSRLSDNASHLPYF